MPVKVIIDTNFLLIPAQFKVDIFDEIDRILSEKPELFIIDKTIGELNNILKTQKGKHKAAAKLALALLDKYPLQQLSPPETERHLNVDNLILKRVKTDKFLVATQDMALKQKLKADNVRMIVLRQKKFLKIV